MIDQIVRQAECACGAFHLTASGDPKVVSSCCCKACQRRTGSLFGVTCFFVKDQISEVVGPQGVFRRRGDSGRKLTFHFCKECGSTLYWSREGVPDILSVAAGAFADRGLPGPSRMVWTENRHPWICTPEGLAEYWRSPP